MLQKMKGVKNFFENGKIKQKKSLACVASDRGYEHVITILNEIGYDVT